MDNLTRVSTLDRHNDHFFTTLPETYQIQVLVPEDYQGPIGFRVEYEEYDPMTNDHFTDARIILPWEKTKALPITPATREAGEPEHRGGGPNKSLWWKFVMPANGTTGFYNLIGTARNATLAAYQGADLRTLRMVRKGTDWVQFYAIGGETYYLAAETAADVVGDIELAYNFTALAQSHEVPGNLVAGFSFEEDSLPWRGAYGMVVNEAGRAADGDSHLFSTAGPVWQDLTTDPGGAYRIRFALKAMYQSAQADMKVTFGDATFQPGPVLLNPTYWSWFEFIATTTNATTRLTLEGSSALDAISVVPLGVAPQIVLEPSNATALAGSTAAFQAETRGSDALWHQWYFEGQPLPGANSPTLVLDNVGMEHAGYYTLIVTNAYGSDTSLPVSLTVETSVSPAIVLQPYGDEIYPGQYFVLSVAAIGEKPLQYQWYKDGEALEGATQRLIRFSEFQASDSGRYQVSVSNEWGTVSSLKVTLSLNPNPPPGGAGFMFETPKPSPGGQGGIVFDVDGITSLTGTNFSAQLYVGQSSSNLRPVGVPKSFQSGFDEGTWEKAYLNLPYIAPGDAFFAQVRIWDRDKGETYEEARALGGRFGRSVIIESVGTSVGTLNWPLNALSPFSLQAGRPEFNVGILTVRERNPDGSIVWELHGEPGFRYLVERRHENQHWQPYEVLTNETGTITFITSLLNSQTSLIFRSRIID